MLEPMTQFNIDQLLRKTSVRHVYHFDSLPSTNDKAIELSAEELELPAVILADQQTAGRGRGQNAWWSGKGALTFSLILDTRQLGLPVRRWPLISLAAALAICEALESLLREKTFQLKWPNDVLCEGRKVCGILIESSPHVRQRLIVGIGVNVNNSLRSAPTELQSKANSLCDLAARALDMTDTLAAILNQLLPRLENLAADGDLSPQFNRRASQNGKFVDITTGSQSLHGICRGIAPDGALLVETPAGVQSCYSGICDY